MIPNWFTLEDVAVLALLWIPVSLLAAIAWVWICRMWKADS